MEFLDGLILHKGTYFNYYIYIIWAVCNGIFLYYKLDLVKIPRLLVITAYLTMVITFSIKLFLVQCRNFTSDISKLTRIFLLTILIQMPLVSFFLISCSLLLCTPVEVCLHVLLLFVTFFESTISFFAVCKSVKHAATQCPPCSQYFPSIEVQPVQRVLEQETIRPARIKNLPTRSVYST